MPSYKFTSPDGQKYTVNGPEGSTEQEAFKMLQAQLGGSKSAAPIGASKNEESSAFEDFGQAHVNAFKAVNQAGINAGAGLVRGAGSFGATIMRVLPNAIGGDTAEENVRRRERLDENARNLLGADTDSLLYGTGKLVGEIAGTAGAGGVLGQGVLRAAPVLSRLGASAPAIANTANALTTSGFRAGDAVGKTALALRAAGGGATGVAAAGAVDPKNALAGGVIGAVLPVGAKVAGKVGGAIRNSAAGAAVSEEVAALARRAKELGITIPADRIANSKPLNALASALNYAPFSGRAATERNMESGLNRALSRTFGQDSDNVTGALRKAQSVLGAKFDDVLKNNSVRVDDDLLGKLGEIERTADRELGSDGMRAIRGQIDELMQKGETGVIDGQAAYNIKRTLDRIGQRSTPEAYHAREMKGALIDALNRSIGPEKAAAFAETRKQYGNMLALEKVAKNGAEGEISVARMANMKNINNPELQELADIAAQFVKPREGQHGAMQRAVVGLGASAAGGLPGLAAGATVGRGSNMLLNSNMLKNALLNGPQPASQATNKLLQGVYRTAPVAANR